MNDRPRRSEGANDDPVSVAGLLSEAGIARRQVALALDALDNGLELQAVIWQSGLARRQVENLWAALGRDRRELDDADRRPVLAEAERRTVSAVVQEFPREPETTIPDTTIPERGIPDTTIPETTIAVQPELVATMRRLIAAAPAAQRSRDHVVATPESVARRATWLAAKFDLGGARVLFLGDHDLTSLALAETVPSAASTVLDIDEELLAYIREHGGGPDGATTYYADLTVSVPPLLLNAFDIVFTDPPYTPEGVGLFAARAIQCLRAASTSRIIIAYGYSRAHPALGLKVQQALLALGLTFEAIHPHFDRYVGAQAIASASDLYVALTTKAARPAADKFVRRSSHQIYTHGQRSIESTRSTLSNDEKVKIMASIGVEVDPAGLEWDAPGVAFRLGDDAPQRTTVRKVLDGDDRVGRAAHAPSVLIADIRGHDDGHLFRLLLAANYDELALVMYASSAVLRGLTLSALKDLMRPKYAVTARRLDGYADLTVVHAVGTNDDASPRAAVLGRPFSSFDKTFVEIARSAHYDECGLRLSAEPARSVVDSVVWDPLDAYRAARPIDVDRGLLGVALDTAERIAGAARTIASSESTSTATERTPEER